MLCWKPPLYSWNTFSSDMQIRKKKSYRKWSSWFVTSGTRDGGQFFDIFLPLISFHVGGVIKKKWDCVLWKFHSHFLRTRRLNFMAVFYFDFSLSFFHFFCELDASLPKTVIDSNNGRGCREDDCRLTYRCHDTANHQINLSWAAWHYKQGLEMIDLLMRLLYLFIIILF